MIVLYVLWIVGAFTCGWLWAIGSYHRAMCAHHERMITLLVAGQIPTKADVEASITVLDTMMDDLRPWTRQ